jgi:hypothetical protein
MTDNPELGAESFGQLGWRQGYVLPLRLVHTLKEQEKLPSNITDQDLLIIVSHDCDLNNPRFEAEPNVELLLARPSVIRNGSYFEGKNPRRYQFLSSSNQVYEVSVHDRFTILRSLLLEYKPDLERHLEHEVARQICLWLSKRYFRSAFPNSFNERIKPAKSAIREKLKNNGQYITAIYIMVSDDELIDEPYEITVKATMKCINYENPTLREEAQGAIDKIGSEIDSCEGIEVLDNSLVSEAKISVDDLRFLKRWDYDSLSFSKDMPDEIAPFI